MTKSKTPFIINFEGIDCSFKDTNATELYRYLKLKYGKEYKIGFVSFPRYNKHACTLAKKFISGRLGDSIPQSAIPHLFMVDMVDFIYDNKNNFNSYDVIIFDRYWLSSAYCTYNADGVKKNYKKIQSIAKDLGLPEPNMTIYMKTNPKIVSSLIKRKPNVDRLELDNDYIEMTNNNFNNLLAYLKVTSSPVKDKNGKIKAKNKYLCVDVYDGNVVLGKDEIFEKIKNYVEKEFNIKKYLKKVSK